MTTSDNPVTGTPVSSGDPSSTASQPASVPKPHLAKQVTFGVGLSSGSICLVGVSSERKAEVQARWGDGRRAIFEYPNAADFWNDLRRLESVSPIACCAVVAADSVATALSAVVGGHESLAHAVSVVLLVPRASTRDVVHAMRAGMMAVADDGADAALLADYIDDGLAASAAELRQRVRSLRVVASLRELSEGERGVMLGILAGKLNKEIAQEMSLSVRTIEQRRREVFRKVGVHHPASLGREVTRAFLSPRLRSEDRDYVATLMEAVPGWKDGTDESVTRAVRFDPPHAGPPRANS